MQAPLVPFACALAAASAAMAMSGGPQATFRSGVRTVAVYVTVSDAVGRLVPDLERRAFQVFDNGKPAEITAFSNGVQPITVAIMLDMSGSMTNRVIRVRESTERFVKALAPDDRARIGTFGAEVAISPVLTANKETLIRVLREELWPGGFTPLWRAVVAAMTSLEGEAGRRVVLVLTDGGDTDYLPGRPGPDDVRQTAVRGSFMVYAIGMEREADGPTITVNNNVMSLSPGGLSSEMVEVAEETGGGHFKLEAASDLDRTFARVAEELRHQYLLGFAPATLDGKAHKIEVRVSEPGCSVRARRSYIAQ